MSLQTLERKDIFWPLCSSCFSQAPGEQDASPVDTKVACALSSAWACPMTLLAPLSSDVVAIFSMCLQRS